MSWTGPGRSWRLNLKVQEEILDIFRGVKGLLRSYEDMGMPPPPLSGQTVGMLRRRGQEAVPGVPPAHTTQHRPRADQPAPLGSLEELRREIGQCRRCRLHKGRKNLVFGEGSPGARLVFVGEGPGYEEDVAGRPFVGRSGRLLTRIIENAMGLTRKEVYICNVVKCHPPGNRDPGADEIEVCLPFLKRQIQIIRPEVICCLGRVACQALIARDFRIKSQRGTWHSFEGIPLMPTFHPAYLLRNPSAKREVWEDIKKVMKKIGLEVKTNG